MRPEGGGGPSCRSGTTLPACGTGGRIRSSPWGPGVLRIAFLAALVGLLQGCTPMDDLMAAIFGRSMRSSASFDPYEDPRESAEGAESFASGNYPPRGDVGLGQPEGTPEPPPPFTQFELDSVAAPLENPVEATPTSLERGEMLFERFCAPCHGPDGTGVTGYIVSAGWPPFSLVTDRVRDFSDGYLYGMIRVGRGVMPRYGDKIEHWDRWDVVNYVRQLQQDAAAAGGP